MIRRANLAGTDDTGKKEFLVVCELSRMGSRRVGLQFDELTAKQARATQYSGAAAYQTRK